MSNIPEMDLDLEKLFLPAWAQESAPSNRYAHHPGGGEERTDRKRDFRPGGRPPGGAGRERSGQRPGGPGRDQGAGRPPGRGPRPQRGDERPRFERPEPPQPLPEVNVALVPDENGVESLARQIKSTGRAYPLFGIAQVVLQKPERYSIRFSIKKQQDGSAAQPLFVCALDDTLWLSEDEVVAHVLKNHFATFYQAERTATEPPKGTYTFVGQCGMSGIILGPPNHHDYQNQLRKLHLDRFSRMPYEAFKARVKIVRDEAVVKKWIEDQSWTTEYVCLNVPEPLKLPNMEEVEKHFRAVHKETIVKSVPEHTVSGVSARGMRCQGLARTARSLVEDQRRFPLQIATTLSQRFGSLGLHFFKVNKTVTHVSVARPSFLDLETTPVSDSIKSIIAFINEHPKCTRRKLVETLAPAPAVPVVEARPETPTDAASPAETSAPAPAPAPSAEPTAEQTAIIADLHWLIHQGHVIEFADGRMDTAKKPLPKPPKPQAKPAATPVESPEPASKSSATPEAAVEDAIAPEPGSPVSHPQEAAPVAGEEVVVSDPVETPIPEQREQV
jgi:hypothetical protein